MAAPAAMTLIASVVGLAAIVAALPPLAQDPSYHRFADARTMLGIPNAANVLSNLPFALVGMAGLVHLLRPAAADPTSRFVDRRERRCWAVAFAGLGLTAVGSGYYHWAPDSARLVWDRLPMTLAFMGLLAAVVAERASPRLGIALLGPLVAVGLASVIHWDVTERAGQGDLRAYGAVQFYPFVVIPLLVLTCPSRYTRGGDYLVAVVIYGMAKVFEAGERPLFALGGILGGHALKHLAAALAGYWLLRMLRRRRTLPEVGAGGYDTMKR